MGSAIIAGIHAHYPVNVCEIDRAKRQRLKRKYAITACDLKTLMDASDVVILAVKPQVFEEVLACVGPLSTRKQLFISIAAGVTTRYIEKRLGTDVRVVRAMPNLPAQIRQGVTGLCPGAEARQPDMRTARKIFQCIGDVTVVAEKDMDRLTAVSGSGPAYFFLFMERYLKAAKALGLEEKVAQQLVMQTVQGSLELLKSSKDSASGLRQKVTSKGGTTFAALQVMTDPAVHYDQVFKNALKAAKKRAKELSK